MTQVQTETEPATYLPLFVNETITEVRGLRDQRAGQLADHFGALRSQRLQHGADPKAMTLYDLCVPQIIADATKGQKISEITVLNELYAEGRWEETRVVAGAVATMLAEDGFEAVAAADMVEHGMLGTYVYRVILVVTLFNES